MTMITGKENIDRFRLVVLKQALQMFAKFKIRANAQLTPTRMLQLASVETGKAYKRGQHAQAALDLQSIIETVKGN